MITLIRSLLLSVIFSISSKLIAVSTVPREEKLANASLYVSCVEITRELYYVDWFQPTPLSDYTPRLKQFTLRTSGMSPKHEYTGPRSIVLYDSPITEIGVDPPFAEAMLPSGSGDYLMILAHGNLNGNRSIYFLNLRELSSSPNTLTVLNGTSARLESTVDSDSSERTLDIPPGLTGGIPIGERGQLTLEFVFRGDAKQWVFRDRFFRGPDQHLILILVPPKIAGSRDLIGRWVRGNPSDL